MSTRASRAQRRLARIGLALVLLIVGAIITPTPVPVGLVLVAAGFAILLVESRAARRAFYGIRKRFPGFSYRIRRASHHLPRRMQRVIGRTDPFPRDEPGV